MLYVVYFKSISEKKRTLTTDLETIAKILEEQNKSDLKLVEFNNKYCDILFDPFNLDLECYSDDYFYRGQDGFDFRLVTTKIAAEIAIAENKKLQ